MTWALEDKELGNYKQNIYPITHNSIPEKVTITEIRSFFIKLWLQSMPETLEIIKKPISFQASVSCGHFCFSQNTFST